MNLFGDVQIELHTLRDYVRWAASLFTDRNLFFGHGTDNAFDEAAYLVLHALHLPPSTPSEYFGARLSLDERRAVLELILRRVEERRPASYLTREAWFAGLRFFVDERVLIPRSPIAELIESGFEPWLGHRSVHHVLDLGTGSGCIGIAAALAFPAAHVDATDISEAALQVAAINVDTYDLKDRVELIHSDLFAELAGRRYDLIVSNPPYVDIDTMMALPLEHRHEPVLGLEAGREGLSVVLRILAQAPDYLNPEAVLVVEVGDSREALLARLPDLPFMWPEFERGGHGVFVLTAEQLLDHRDQIRAVRP